MAIFNSDRLSHWYLAVSAGWILTFTIIGVLLFHLALDVSLTQITVVAGIGCGTQLLVLPWLFSARSTARNPEGLVARRSAAVLVWLSSMTILIFYYLQRGWPQNPAAQREHIIFWVALAVTLIALNVAVALSQNLIRKFSRFFQSQYK